MALAPTAPAVYVRESTILGTSAADARPAGRGSQHYAAGQGRRPLQRWHQGAARAPGGSMPRPAQQGSGGRQVGGLRVGQQPTGGATGGRQLAVSRRTAQTAGR